MLPVHYKNSPSVVEKERLQCDKKHHEKPTANIRLKSEGLNAFPQDQEQGTDVHYHHNCIGGPGQYNKEIKHTQIKKEELCLFTENITVHVENPKDYKNSC